MQRNKSAELLQKIMHMESEEELLALAMELHEEQEELIQVKCYQQAARLGSAEALYRLGEVYEVGIGTACDEAEAVYWYTKAAMKRHADAMSVLADYYYYGIVVEQNDDTARMLLLLSTDSGYTKEKLKKWFDIELSNINDVIYQKAEEYWKQFIEAAERKGSNPLNSN